jgi:hypothetical protein
MAFGRELLLQASTFPSSHPIDAAGARNRSTDIPMPPPYANPMPVLRQRLTHMHLPTAKSETGGQGLGQVCLSLAFLMSGPSRYACQGLMPLEGPQSNGKDWPSVALTPSRDP